jgi:hypothetical protein
MRKIDEIEAGSLLAVGMSLFALNLDHVGGAESHASAAGNAVMSAGFREALELNMTAVGGTHIQIFLWILNRNHRSIDTPDSHPHSCDEAPATHQNVSDHTHKRLCSSQFSISNGARQIFFSLFSSLASLAGKKFFSLVHTGQPVSPANSLNRHKRLNQLTY